MCGIAGVVDAAGADAVAAVEAMCERMWARGPDDGGVETRGGTVLGSRRLAIIDPSPAGHQPMRDAERGTTIVFNGMTYNFRELREQLARDGVRFDSDCDTEVVLKAYGRYGAACVEHLRGMFAFAVWDERDRSLFLARDRLGIKPLYYAQRGAALVFASQVKALLASRLVEPAMSAAAIQTFLAYGAVSEPLTAIDGVVALPAGHRARFRDGRLDVERYWHPPDGADVAEVAAEDASREIRELLDDAVRRHLVSDAPLGIFLSGGLDSSLLAALAARETPHVRTVSVVFDGSPLSEREHVERVVARIRSDHVWMPLAAADLLAWTSDAFDAMDQPTFDGINTYVVSRAAAQTGLKVALSGLGADELFDGYGHARRVTLLERARRLPRPVTAAAGRALVLAGDRSQAAKAREWLVRRPDPGSSYELLRRLFLPGEVASLVPGSSSNGTPPPPRLAGVSGAAVARLDLANYMRNVLLRDTDAMSMANSLEVRVPYLDHPFVERVLRLPQQLVAGRAKALLADAGRDVLPPETLDRRKQGFVLPLASWMRDAMRVDVERTLSRPPTALAGLLDEREVARVWRAFADDGRRWLRPWSLFALYRWAETVE